MSNEFKPTRRQLIKGTGSVAVGASLSGCALLGGQDTNGADEQPQPEEGIPSEPINIAFFTFTSGGASVFGTPSVNAAKLLVDDINANGGVLGEREISAEYIDEAAGTDQMVNRVRELSTQGDVDAIIGFVSSGDALAVAPVAEQNEQLTLIYDAGTYQLFEEEQYDYVFRPSAHLSVGAVGAARYIKEHLDVETVAGINQDYSWGHDNWDVFKGAVKQLMPEVEVVSERFPELMSDDFTSHITALNSANPDVIFSSFWGGDTINFATQANSAGLFDDIEMIYGGGEHMLQNVGDDMPEGIITGARGPHWPNANVDWPQHQFIDSYYDEYGNYPIYPSMHMYQAIRFYVQSVEKAYQISGNYPSQEQIATALEGSAIQTPNGFVSMPNHQAKEPAMFGRTVHSDEYDFAQLEDRKYIAADLVNPPEGLDTMEWIETLE